ncbi:hypothetical protein POM88_012506 [Heracleum sosnowskyi]|uniref:Uncharacterized protein n=1 Tax=Heracleum sosnowskyi TaxID=360622 RepID=A0AAD8MXE3_9APIA|nr:hypothetical protein POM88_012506 [Heracleum sosnowskyi]
MCSQKLCHLAIDTLSKKKALEKSKYEQSLETVRRFIALDEKELELYYCHIALYGDPSNRNPNSTLMALTVQINWLSFKLRTTHVAFLITTEDYIVLARCGCSLRGKREGT